MTANAEILRAERFAEISAIIQRDRFALIDCWSQRAVEEQPHAARVHHEALRDHLPDFLEELATALEDSDPSASPQRRSAARHGEQRWEVGWSLAELVRDYRILRLVILEHLDGCLTRPLWLREVQAVGLALDEAIESSVERFVHNSDEQVRHGQDLLRLADRRKNEFLATLAHELRNPLAPLRNSLEVVRHASDSPDVFRQVREIMERQVGQMTRLVEDLLDIARVAEGKLELRQDRCDLLAVIDLAVQMSTPLREARRHRLSIRVPEEPLWLDGDLARLVQVFVNLLNNAAKFTPEGGHITLEGHAEKGEAIVRIKDNGVGIPADQLGRVFDLFAQVDTGPERTAGGLGIGLSLVRRLVELHGGKVAASSPGRGQGAEFTIHLPRSPEASRGPAEKETKVESAPPRHILIIEDNPDGRDSLAMLLGLLGHRVATAEDGRRGVESALALRPEVALIDIGLPELDGYQVARQVRQALGKEILLVAMTGYGQPADRLKATQAGFDAHLLKPVELAKLEKLLAGPRWPCSS